MCVGDWRGNTASLCAGTNAEAHAHAIADLLREGYDFWKGTLPVSGSLLLEAFILRCFRSDHRAFTPFLDLGDGAGEGRLQEEGKYTLCKSACEHCFSAPARAASMKVLSLQRHAKSLAWQPVEPIAERAGLC